MSSKLTNKGNLTGEKNDVQPISGREQNWNSFNFKLNSGSKLGQSKGNLSRETLIKQEQISNNKKVWWKSLFSRIKKNQ